MNKEIVYEKKKKSSDALGDGETSVIRPAENSTVWTSPTFLQASEYSVLTATTQDFDSNTQEAEVGMGGVGGWGISVSSRPA